MLLVNTPYDDVFKTLSNDCRQLLLPVINEIFHKHYTGKEKIIFLPNEHFINQQNGHEQERITDTCFKILGDDNTLYHLECQSTTDATMLIRMFEYDAQIALDNGELGNSYLTVTFPNSAIFYLRSNSNTPNLMHVHMLTPGGELTYPIPVMKINAYSLNDIFEKNLLFLIPFYIFVHEKNFIEYNENTEKLNSLLTEYAEIKNRLETLCHQKVISELTYHTIIDMSNKVLEHIAKGHEKVKKGVKSVMGGKILEYEAKTIWKNGLAAGISQGKFQALSEMVRDGFISAAEAAKRLGISTEEFQKLLKN